VPVTVTVNVPAVDPETVRVELSEPDTLAELRLAVMPLDDTVAERLTVPLKPFIAVIVMVDIPELPAVKLIMEGLAAMVKSAGRTGLTVNGSQALVAPLLFASPE
jgi:hypothetical protein